MPKQVDQPANLFVTSGTNVAANTEFSQTVPAGEVWELLTVQVANTQAGAGASQPILVIDDGTTAFYNGFGCVAAQAISTTCTYQWGVSLPLAATITGAGIFGQSSAPLPGGLLIPPGGRIRSVTLGLSANTDYGAPVFYYKKYRATQ